MLQNDFKKRYKTAVKGLAAAVENFGCLAAVESPLTAINSAVTAVQKIPEPPYHLTTCINHKSFGWHNL